MNKTIETEPCSPVSIFQALLLTEIGLLIFVLFLNCLIQNKKKPSHKENNFERQILMPPQSSSAIEFVDFSSENSNEETNQVNNKSVNEPKFSIRSRSFQGQRINELREQEQDQFSNFVVIDLPAESNANLTRNESSSSLKILSDSMHNRSKFKKQKKQQRFSNTSNNNEMLEEEKYNTYMRNELEQQQLRNQRSTINSGTFEEETYNSYIRNEIENEFDLNGNQQQISIRREKSVEKISRSKSWDHGRGSFHK